MMNAADCRAKAQAAVELGVAAATPLAALQWQVTAQEWVALALMADAHDVLTRSLLDRSLN